MKLKKNNNKKRKVLIKEKRKRERERECEVSLVWDYNIFQSPKKTHRGVMSIICDEIIFHHTPIFFL